MTEETSFSFPCLQQQDFAGDDISFTTGTDTVPASNVRRATTISPQKTMSQSIDTELFGFAKHLALIASVQSDTSRNAASRRREFLGHIVLHLRNRENIDIGGISSMITGLVQRELGEGEVAVLHSFVATMNLTEESSFHRRLAFMDLVDQLLAPVPAQLNYEEGSGIGLSDLTAHDGEETTVEKKTLPRAHQADTNLTSLAGATIPDVAARTDASVDTDAGYQLSGDTIAPVPGDTFSDDDRAAAFRQDEPAEHVHLMAINTVQQENDISFEGLRKLLKVPP